MKVHKIFLLKCPRMPQYREIPGYQNISRIPESIEMMGNIGTKRANCMADYSLILISIFSIHVFGPMFLFVTPENNKKPKVFSGGSKMGTLYKQVLCVKHSLMVRRKRFNLPF